jgi:hypothetical protein
VFRCTNLVSMVSLVIPHDTLDNADSSTFVNEDISLSESRVVFSFNSDNDSAVLDCEGYGQVLLNFGH